MKNLMLFSFVSLLTASLLVGCGNENEKIKSIKIDEESISASYYVGDTVSYSNLKIKLLDENKKELNSLKYSDNKDSIKIVNEIETTTVGSYEFKVSYTYKVDENEYTLSDSLTYTVSERNTIGDISYVSWQKNVNYTNYETNKNNATFANDGTSNFISNKGKFYVGNQNRVNLLPIIYTYNATTDQAGISSTLPTNTEIKIYDQSNYSTTKTEKQLSDYFASDCIDQLQEGYIKFKDDLSSVDTKDIVLVFSYNKSGFSDIEYYITIVDGYNITNAKELVLIDNQKTDSSYHEIKKEVLNDDSISETFSYETFVLFNDVSITKDDLPSYTIYSEEQQQEKNFDERLVGSLIDWVYIYEHEPTSETKNGSFNFYGNYNKLTLDESFPYVLSDDRYYNGVTPTIDSSQTVISTHAVLFGNDSKYTSEDYSSSYYLNFYDFAATGNQGLQTEATNPDTGLVEGGVLFTKSRKISYNNLVVNKFFTIHINNGPWKVGGEDIFASCLVRDSKLFDCFSSMLFNYSDGLIDVEHSILSSAGGFLLINQANPFNATKYDGIDTSKFYGSHINIDSSTILDNYVTGSGGWFDLYGVTSQIPTLLSFDSYFQQYGKSYTKTQNSLTKFNAIALTMNSDLESAGSLSSGMRATVKIGNNTYLDYAEGKESLDTAYTNLVSNTSDQTYQAAFLQNMTQSQYGTNFFAQMFSIMFMTHNTSNLYILPTVDSNYQANGITALTNYFTSMSTTLFPTVDLTNNTQLDSDYLSIFFFMGSYSNNLTTLEGMLSGYSSYSGSTAYNLVISFDDYN